MNRVTIYFSLFAIIFTLNSAAQSFYGRETAYDETNLKAETHKSDSQVITILDYDIDLQLAAKAKVLKDSELRFQLSLSSKTSNIVIPKGSVIDIYRYFPKEASWIVNYNGKWGFVTSIALRPLQNFEDISEDKQDCEPPKMLTILHPKYPFSAKNNKIQGQVVVKILITKTGEIKEMDIVQSIPALDDAALNALKKMKFKPGKFRGKPADTWIMIPVDFTL